jgi:hypothetical protein
VRLLFAICVFVCCAVGAESDWHVVLNRIGRTVTDAVNKSDNYICAQDLARYYYVTVSPAAACHEPPALPASAMRVQDRLKLDVAVSQGNEIYSWHGARRFSSNEVNEVVREGPISSGSFSGYLRNIFGEHGINFQFRGIAKLDDIEVFKFDYEVPLAASHYDIQAGKSFETVPFHGSFAARTDDYQLVSLIVTAEGEKATTKANICAAESRLTYQMVKIAGHESLLPASFDLLMGSRNGVFTESKGRYSECREYKGESTVRFDMDDAVGGPSKAPELQSEPLASGLILPISLVTEIDEDSAYAGLPVDAVLQRDVKISKGEKLLRGATLHGAVTEFEIFKQPSHKVAMKLEFNSITDGNKLYLCDAVHHQEESFLPTYAGGRGRRLGRSPTMQQSSSAAPDTSMEFEAKHVHLRKYNTDLITINQAAADSK